MEHGAARATRRPARVPRRLEKLVASGRLSADEANRLRSGETGEVEEAVVAIRAWHAGARLEAAVAAGEISRAEADAILERLRAGEHSPELRARLKRLRTPESGAAGQLGEDPGPDGGGQG